MDNLIDVDVDQHTKTDFHTSGITYQTLIFILLRKCTQVFYIALKFVRHINDYVRI